MRRGQAAWSGWRGRSRARTFLGRRDDRGGSCLTTLFVPTINNVWLCVSEGDACGLQRCMCFLRATSESVLPQLAFAMRSEDLRHE